MLPLERRLLLVSIKNHTLLISSYLEHAITFCFLRRSNSRMKLFSSNTKRTLFALGLIIVVDVNDSVNVIVRVWNMDKLEAFKNLEPDLYILILNP